MRVTPRSSSAGVRSLARAACIAVFVLAAFSARAFAIDYVVTKTTDSSDGLCDSDCSLREAIIAANLNAGPDRVILGSGLTYTLSLMPADPTSFVPASGDLDVTDALTIDGNGSIVDAAGIDRVFDIRGAFTVTINLLTMTNGAARGFLAFGGGLYVGEAANVFLNGSTVIGNVTDDGGGGRNNGGGIAVVGSFDGSTGIATLARLTLVNSTVSNNLGFSGGGILCVVCGLTVSTSTIASNNASGLDGGGIAVFGDASTVGIVGSNLTSNIVTAGRGGALSVPFGSSVSTLSRNRIVGNGAVTGQAIFNSVASVTATNNWWGCNFGPGATGVGCAAATNDASGTVTTSPYLTLGVSALPVSIGVGNAATVTADLTFNSASADTSGGGTVPNGIIAAFSGTLGTFATPAATTVSGRATDLFTASATGTASLSTTVDGQTVTTSIAIGYTSTTTLTASPPSPAFVIDPVLLTATVTSDVPAGGTPNGTVIFKNGVTTLAGCGAVPVDGSGVATCNIPGSTLTPGVKSFTAEFDGGTNHFASTSAPLSYTYVSCTVNPIVANSNDSGTGSLRQAIADACPAGTITFNMGTVASPIALTTDTLTLARDVTITGPGADVLTVERTSGAFRIVTIGPGRTVAMSGLTIAGGLATSSPDRGGAIFNDGSALTLSAVTLQGNTATFGGALFNTGDVQNASVTILNSTLSGNSAEHGGAVFNESVDGETATLVISNSTISANTAAGHGGGLFNGGSVSPVTLTNVTITGNRADADGNLIGAGGGLHVVAGSGAVELRNTLVAGNVAGFSPAAVADDVVGTLDAASTHTLIGSDSGMLGVTNGTNNNLVGTAASPLDARLGSLQANGGTTFTHALLAGSPAFDAGDDAAAATAGLTTDQRGLPRLSDAADAGTVDTADIGAFEARASLSLLPDVTIVEDGSTTVMFEVGDVDLITAVTATSANTTLVPNNPANLSVSGAGTTRTLTIVPVANGFGTADITVTVASGTEESSDTLRLTVMAVTDAATVTGATTNEDTQTTSGLVLLKSAVDGVEVTHFLITAITNGTLFQSDGTTPIASNAVITVAQGGAGLKFTPAPNFNGTASFIVQAATDAAGTGAGPGVTATIVVNAVTDAATVTGATTTEDTQTTSGLVLLKNVADGVEVTHFLITGITNGTLFQNDGTTPIAPNEVITIAQGGAGLRFTPAPNFHGTASFVVQAATGPTGTGAGPAVTATIVVSAITDVATVTGATTIEDTQTTSGLVLLKSATDGVEVTHFLITAIANGTLFQNDGTTPIASNAVITIAQGGAGLRFTPAPNFNGTASFVVQSATDAAGTGAGPGATATIVVSAVADTPSLTNASTVSDTQTTSGLVVARNPADGPEVTHFKVTAISGGTLFQNDGTTPIAVGAFLTFAEANAGLRFTPTHGSTATGHVTVQASLSASDGGLGGGLVTADILLNAVIITTGADGPGTSLVRRFSSAGQPIAGPTASFTAFAGSAGGVRVADADLTGDGVADIIAGTGPGVAARIVVFDGVTGAIVRDVTPGFAGNAGVFVAAGDVDGDGWPDIIAGDGGTSTMVRVFSGTSNAPLWTTIIPGAEFLGGVRVAAGDVDSDGYADLIVGSGPGAAALVRVYSGVTHAELRTLSPYPAFIGGVFVAAGDVNGDGYADVITGADAGGGPHVRVFDGPTGVERFGFFATAGTFTGGVRVAAGDVNGDGSADVITALGPGGDVVQIYDGISGAPIGPPITVTPATGSGLFISATVPTNRMVIDAPTNGATVSPAFTLRGWAFEATGPGVGVDAIHVWAYPVGPGSPQFLGAAALGDARPDVAAIFGARVATSGYHLDVTGLADGQYDLVAFAHGSASGVFNMRRVVRVTVLSPGVDVLLQVDLPSAGAVHPNLRVAGWAFDVGASGVGSGIEAVHVWAYPMAGGSPTFLGAATLGDSRPDVAAAHGPRAANSGYHLDVTGVPAGDYMLAVFAKPFAQATFTIVKTVNVTVTPWAPTVQMSVDVPPAGPLASGTFQVSGWALAQEGPSRPGIQAVHVWAYPVAGGSPSFLGAATLGFARPDIGAIYGPGYETSGFALNVSSLPSGTWDLAVFPLADGASGFGAAVIVRVTVP